RTVRPARPQPLVQLARLGRTTLADGRPVALVVSWCAGWRPPDAGASGHRGTDVAPVHARRGRALTEERGLPDRRGAADQHARGRAAGVAVVVGLGGGVWVSASGREPLGNGLRAVPRHGWKSVLFNRG